MNCTCIPCDLKAHHDVVSSSEKLKKQVLDYSRGLQVVVTNVTCGMNEHLAMSAILVEQVGFQPWRNTNLNV